MVSFHECCLSGYTFLQHLDREGVARWPSASPTDRRSALIDVAREFGTVVTAGLVESDTAGRLYNCYVAVGPEGYLTSHRKLHPFITPYFTPGDTYNVIDVRGVKVGFLTCYDNNLPENVRITTLLGTEVIMMPHVTGCLPSVMPGRGTVEPASGRTDTATRSGSAWNSRAPRAAAG